MIRFRADIEGLRAVAVLLVIGNHLQVPGLGGGFIGVDVFFVISGYLITSLLAAEYADKAAKRQGMGSISIAHFYLRRARRILPASLAVIAAVWIASHELLNSLRAQQVQHDALWVTFFGSNVNFIRQANDYFAADLAVSSPFRHYWSLAVEEQFYFVWPVLFLVITGRHGLTLFGRRITWRTRLLTALTVVGVRGVARVVDIRDVIEPRKRVLLDVHACMGAGAGSADRSRHDIVGGQAGPTARVADVRRRSRSARGGLLGDRRRQRIPGVDRAAAHDRSRVADRRGNPYVPSRAEPPPRRGADALPRTDLVLPVPVALAVHRLRRGALPRSQRARFDTHCDLRRRSRSRR